MVVFANVKGKFIYVTQNKVSSDYISSQGSAIQPDEKGRAIITVDFREADAAIL